MKLFNKYFFFLLLSTNLFAQAQVDFLKSRKNISVQDWTFERGVKINVEKNSYLDVGWEKITTPHTYNMDGINNFYYYRGEAWYRSKITIPKKMENERIFIRFEGVGHEATVYINEKKAGKKHIGGYSAFCYEITDKVKAGQEVLIAVSVNNIPSFKRIPVDDFLFNHYGGIYRPVTVFSTPNSNINPTHYASSGVFTELKKLTKDKASIKITTHLTSTSTSKKGTLTYTIKDKDKKIVTTLKKEVNFDEKSIIDISSLDIQNPVLWNGKINPYLYTVDVELNENKAKDFVEVQFGVRQFSFDPNEGLFLNGKPYDAHGVARHQEWEQYGPALSDEHHRKDMDLIEEMGATTLRLSHYQHSDLLYKIGDEKGILIWAEIPFVHDWSGREGENAKAQLKELIHQNYNHASIFVWGLWNEVRAYKDQNANCVTTVHELNKIAHDLDKTRKTVSASDREVDPMNLISDLQAWNKYYGWYGNKPTEYLNTWLEDTHKKHPKLNISVSEYGAGGNIKHQDITKLEKPKGTYFPEPYQTQYHETSWKVLKDKKYVWGSFVWNMFDFALTSWNRGGKKSLNHKGLVTFDRKIKKDAFWFYKANWSKEPVLYIEGRRNNVRKKQNTSVKVFTNQKKTTLFLNGKRIASKKLTSAINTLIFDNVVLKEGKNTIKVVSGKFTDEIQWIYQK